MNRRVLGSVLVLAVASPTGHVLAARATFPLLPGEAVATCGIGTAAPPPVPAVTGVIDLRDPGCDPGAVVHENWLAPMNHNELPNTTSSAADEWTLDNLGPVFGIELDDALPPNIYVAASSAYGDFPVTGRIFQLDGITGAVRTFATLPNASGAGLGNLAWDPEHQLLFATNMEDGRIYRIDASGVLLDSFDPFSPDDGLSGFAPRGERLWALGYWLSRLYFSVWVEDYNHPDLTRDNEIWSVAIDPGTGAFVPTDVTLEITIPPLAAQNFACPVSDLSFAGDGRLVLAERTMKDDFAPSAHYSRVLEYTGGHLAWSPSAANYAIGEVLGQVSSAGGVDWDCASPDACNAGRHLWAMGDALRFDLPGPLFVYGLQGLPDGGGDVNTSYLIDLNGDTTSPLDKTFLGDVDIYRPRCVTAAVAGPPGTVCLGTPITLDASGSTVTGCLGTVEYRWLEGATVLRDWSPNPRFGLTPASTASYRVEVRCGSTACGCAGFDTVTITVHPPPTAGLAPVARVCSGQPLTLDATGSVANGCPVALEYQFRDGVTVLQAWSPASTFGPFPAGTTTTYGVDVRCPGATGCATVAEVDVTVVPVPVAAAGPDEDLCENTPLTLSGSGSSGPGCPGPLSYEWWEGAVRVAGPSPSPTWNPPTTPIGTRTWSLRVSCPSLSGCAASDDVNLTVRDCTLAVSFARFSAHMAPDGHSASIIWSTYSEHSTLGFVVERAVDRLGPFTAVAGALEAHGPFIEYRLTDATATASMWYRIVELTSAGRGDETVPFAITPVAAPDEHRPAGTRRRARTRER